MQNKKLKLIFIILLILLLSGSLIFLIIKDYAKTQTGVSIKELKTRYKDKISFIEEIEKTENELKNNPGKVGAYANAGLRWKTLADQVQNDPSLYEAARIIYEKGIRLTGERNALFLLNAGDMARYEKKYDIAEKYYRLSITNVPIEQMGYIALANLYKTIGKSESEILGIYSMGIEAVAPPTQIILERGDFLFALGKFKEALRDYEEVNKASPSAGIEEQIKLIKSKL